MPARNIYHEAVVAALVADGWTVTDSSFVLTIRSRRVVGLIAAEKAGRRVGVLPVADADTAAIGDLATVCGRFAIAQTLLRLTDRERVAYVALPSEAFYRVFGDALGRYATDDLRIKVFVFRPDRREGPQWIG